MTDEQRGSVFDDAHIIERGIENGLVYRGRMRDSDTTADVEREFDDPLPSARLYVEFGGEVTESHTDDETGITYLDEVKIAYISIDHEPLPQGDELREIVESAVERSMRPDPPNTVGEWLSENAITIFLAAIVIIALVTAAGMAWT